MAAWVRQGQLGTAFGLVVGLVVESVDRVVVVLEGIGRKEALVLQEILDLVEDTSHVVEGLHRA